MTLLKETLNRRGFTLFLVLLLVAPLPSLALERLDGIAAVVNEDVVLLSELQEEVAAVKAQIRARGDALPPEDQLRRQVLERLVMQRLQINAARRAGIAVDDATLDAAVRRVAEQNNLDLRQFRDALEQQGMNMADYRERLRREILISRVRQRQLRQRVNITPQEIEQYLSQRSEDDRQFRISHILLETPGDADEAARERTRALAETIRGRIADGLAFATAAATYSDSRTALEGGDLGWRSIGEVPSMLQNRLGELSEGEMTPVIRGPSGYHIFRLDAVRTPDQRIVTQTRARHILARTNAVTSSDEARREVAQLRERILGGESFEGLARANSDDEISASRGGSLGWVSPGTMVSAFEQQMDELAPGEISEPFQTRFGWHIVQVLERRQQDATEDYRRSEAAREIRQRREDEELDLWLRQLREEAYVDYRLEA